MMRTGKIEIAIYGGGGHYTQFSGLPVWATIRTGKIFCFRERRNGAIYIVKSTIRTGKIFCFRERRNGAIYIVK